MDSPSVHVAPSVRSAADAGEPDLPGLLSSHRSAPSRRARASDLDLVAPGSATAVLRVGEGVTADFQRRTNSSSRVRARTREKKRWPVPVRTRTRIHELV